jgi:hypothetical protein
MKTYFDKEVVSENINWNEMFSLIPAMYCNTISLFCYHVGHFMFNSLNDKLIKTSIFSGFSFWAMNHDSMQIAHYLYTSPIEMKYSSYTFKNFCDIVLNNMYMNTLALDFW